MAKMVDLNYERLPEKEMLEKASLFEKDITKRRTVRDYSSDPVSEDVIKSCLRAAASAPSGANRQPWHFVVISDPKLKSQIREAAEKEEREFYGGRASDEWLESLEPFGTDEHKPFLEEAPYLIAIFAEQFEQLEDGKKKKNYYVQESVGIATGMLISALHLAGLATLTHTPSPMNFLNTLLKRPKNERPYLLLVVGLPKKDAQVPDISKKALSDVASFNPGCAS